MPNPKKIKEMKIYDTVDSWSIMDWERQFDNLESGDELTIRINSRGGGVFEGYQIYNQILTARNKGVIVKTCIDGIAASIASIIALAGSPVCIGQNAMLMIHKPFAMTVGDTQEHIETAATLQKIENQIIETYKEKTNLPEATIKEYMNKETYFTAQEALKLGFVNEIFNQTLTINPNNFKNLSANDLHKKYALAINNKTMPDSIIVPPTPAKTEQNEPTIAEMQRQFVENREEIKNLKEKVLQGEAENLVNAAILQGKITAEAKDQAINIAKADPKCFQAFIEKIKAPEAPEASLAEIIKAANANPENKTARADATNRQNWTMIDWEKNDPKGLDTMMATNKPLYDKLYNETYTNQTK